MMDDTIEVRSDERLDEKKLIEYLTGKLDDVDVEQMQIRQFGGGAANLTYELIFPEKSYVLRRPPLGRIAKSAHDMGREYHVLSALHEEFPYAPMVFHYCQDESIVGSEFFVMERKYGHVIRRKLPSNYAAIDNIGETLTY